MQERGRFLVAQADRVVAGESDHWSEKRFVAVTLLVDQVLVRHGVLGTVFP
jgi:hypothetical protein